MTAQTENERHTDVHRIQRSRRGTYPAWITHVKRMLGPRIFYACSRPLRLVERCLMHITLRPLARRTRGRSGPFGVNLVCFASSENGLGESGRSTLRSLTTAQVPVAVLDQSLLPLHTDADTSSTPAHPFSISIIQMNPDHLVHHVSRHGTGWFDDKYVIGYWAWELLEIPNSWKDTARLFDEIWTLSEYSKNALSPAVDVPVFSMPLAVSIPSATHMHRAFFGWPEKAFIFLFIFDFHSRIERKNPIGLIAAFRQAFPADEHVRLVIKCDNAHHFPEDEARLRQAAGGDVRITLMEEHLSREHLGGLLQCCDAYVSLHRAEGFGLTIAEAMLLGKPTIATAYSGSMEFMTEECCFPVGFSLTTLKRNDGPYAKGSVWAEPNMEDAARQMRYVFEHPDKAREVGQKGAERIRRDFSSQSIGERMARRLAKIPPIGG